MSRFCTAAVALSLLCAAGLTSKAAAQLASAPLLPLGRTIDGTLTNADPTLNERGRFQVFRLDVTAGRRYSVVMRADVLDSYLSVARQVNGLTDYLASDDDGAGNSNARLRWTPRLTGTYYLIAQALAGDAVGAFTLRLDTMATTIVTPPRPVTLGASTTGELAETDPVLDDGKGAYYDLYRVQGRKGQRLLVEMSAGELDSFLGIGRMVGDSLHVEATDDDGGGDKDARLLHTLPEDGTYIIRAQALDVNATGAYTLKLSERPARTATVVALATALAVSGALRDSDPDADDGTFFDTYRITVRAGETVSITMRSSVVDSYLTLGRMMNDSFTSVATDDDSAGGNNAQIEHTFEEGGEYLIRAGAVGTGKTGAYTIRLDRPAVSPSVSPARPARRP